MNQADADGAGNAYRLLGQIAHRRRDNDAAEQWYRKALEIFERIDDEAWSSEELLQFGPGRDKPQRVRGRGEVVMASDSSRGEGERRSRCHEKLSAVGVGHATTKAISTPPKGGVENRWQSSRELVPKLKGREPTIIWALSPKIVATSMPRNNGCGNQYTSLRSTTTTTRRRAITIQLGTIACRRGDFDVAEKWYRKSLEIDEKRG